MTPAVCGRAGVINKHAAALPDKVLALGFNIGRGCMDSVGGHGYRQLSFRAVRLTPGLWQTFTDLYTTMAHLHRPLHYHGAPSQTSTLPWCVRAAVDATACSVRLVLALFEPARTPYMDKCVYVTLILTLARVLSTVCRALCCMSSRRLAMSVTKTAAMPKPARPFTTSIVG